MSDFQENLSPRSSVRIVIRRKNGKICVIRRGDNGEEMISGDIPKEVKDDKQS